MSRIAIAGDFTFPHGSAASSRVRNFAEGFIENGAQVRILSLSPQVVSEGEDPRKLRSLGPIEYRCLAEQSPGRTATRLGTKRNRAWGAKLRWFVDAYTVGFRVRRELDHLLSDGRWELVLLYGRSAARLLPLVSIARRHSVPTLLDVTELPSMFGGVGGVLSPIYWDWQIGSRRLAASVDGVSVIARGLESSVRIHGGREVILVPGIEGWEDLLPAPDVGPGDEFMLLYVSALIRRDNPEMLFECVRRARRLGAKIVLQVTGRYSGSPEAGALVAKVQSDPELSGAVRFLGELPDDRLRAMMRASDGLVLLRRNAETEVCSFPTRLVEYLQQGRPVVISDVGDISSYLENGREAILLDPKDPDRAAGQLAGLAAMPDRGHALGLAGRVRGAREFDRRTHTRRLLEFAGRLAASRGRGGVAL